MAKQSGIIRLSGPLGNLSFYEMKGEYYLRRQTRHAVATDPRFKKTHLTGLDFGTASRASKLLRTALTPAIRPFSDEHIASRLSGRFVTVVQADHTHTLGRRKILTQHLHLLQGFEFNRASALQSRALSATTSINRATGQITLSVSTTSRRLADTSLVAAIAAVNFDNNTYTRQDPTTFTLGETKAKDVALSIPPAQDPRAVLIVTLGISSPDQRQPGVMAIVGVHQPSAPSRPGNRIKRSLHAPPRHNRPSRAVFSLACPGMGRHVSWPQYKSTDYALRRQTFPRPREISIELYF